MAFSLNISEINVTIIKNINPFIPPITNPFSLLSFPDENPPKNTPRFMLVNDKASKISLEKSRFIAANANKTKNVNVVIIEMIKPSINGLDIFF